MAYLTYFIDSIFSMILEKINYNENIDSLMKPLLNSTLNSISDKQACMMDWVKKILDIYDNQ